MGSYGTPYGPGVQIFTPDTPFEDIVAVMKRDGGVYIKNLVSSADVDKAYTDVLPRLNADQAWDGEFFPPETRRAPALVALSPTYARTQMMNPLFQKLCDYFLTTRHNFWWGDTNAESVSKPYLHGTLALRVGPGGKAQPLHRDDAVVHNWVPEVEEWDDERDKTRVSGLNLFVAGSKISKENGGTQFIPGSHLWGTDRKTAPSVADCHHSEMQKGDAFIMFPSCYHGAGTNETTDQERLVFATLVVRGYLRQEENQFLAIPKEVAKTYERDIQNFIGYSFSDPACGGVEYLDPITVLYPEMAKTARSIDPQVATNGETWSGQAAATAQ